MSSRGPSASVVIPAFNAGGFIGETLDSILSNAGDDVETIVVDDGSTDDTAAVVRAYARGRVRYTRIENSGGPARPRNVGIELAEGRHVFMFDSDDLMRPGKIERSISLLERQDQIGFVFTNFVRIDEQGQPLGGKFLDGYDHFWRLPRQRVGLDEYTIASSAAYEGLFHENYVGTSGVAAPREVLRAMGGFDESLRYSEDRDLWYRIARGHPLGFIDIVGHAYRVRQASLSHSDGERLLPYQIRVLDKQLSATPDPRLAALIRDKIADLHVELGYAYRTKRDFGAAARAYGNGINVGWQAWKGLALALLRVPTRTARP